MKDMGIVQGSAIQAVPLVIGFDTVYVHTDIQKIDINLNDFEVQSLYQYHEIQYDKDEYIAMMANSQSFLQSQLFDLTTQLVTSGVV